MYLPAIFILPYFEENRFAKINPHEYFFKFIFKLMNLLQLNDLHLQNTKINNNKNK